ANLRGKKVDIEIFDQEKLLAEDDETAIKVIRDDQETDWINAVKIDDMGKAIVKVKLRKKSDEDYKKQQEALKDDKQARLFLKVTCQGDDRKHQKVFLEGEAFVVEKPCDCGSEAGYKFKCVKYGSQYEPLYSGSIDLEDYQEWDNLIQNNEITSEEKEILIAMSSNEGNLDAIQSYDSEALSVGAMQKTVNSQGKGEFPI
ncbi:MAG: hypothetical protein AAGC64_10735, partial [Bacteroidota bacterium]